MDETQVYVPVEAVAGSESTNGGTGAQLVALDSQTGATKWTYPVATLFTPLLQPGAVVVAASDEIHAVDIRDGRRQWGIPLDRPLRTPLLRRGAFLLAVTEGNELVALDVDRRRVAWRTPLGETGAVRMTADDEAAYIAAETGQTLRVNLSDGGIAWRRRLDGVLVEPVLHDDRLFVGSNAHPGSLWSLDTRTGRNRWAIRGRLLAGAVVGTAVVGKTVYVVSTDTFVRALNRDSGNQVWKKPVGTRPVLVPQIIGGVVVVTGLTPTMSTFLEKDGTPVSTWSAPEESVLQGVPLLAQPAPFRVTTVVLFRDGQITGLRSTAMLFKESDPLPLSALPGRLLPPDP